MMELADGDVDMCEKIYAAAREKMNEILESSASDEDVEAFSDYFNHFYQEPKEDFKLYRYVGCDYNSIRNLEKETIYLTTNGVMNDIYEGLPKFTNSMGIYRNYSKLKSLEDIMLMKCFSEVYDIPLMWGHYAGGGTGFCIEYNLSNISNNDEILTHIYPVVYREKRMIYEDFEFLCREKESLDDYILDYDEPDDYFPDVYKLFVTKGKEWAYEREWRILYSKYDLYKNNDDWQAKRQIYFPYTSAVYLGAKMEPKYREHIIEIVNRLNATRRDHRGKITLYEMKLDEQDFKFNFERLILEGK